MLERQIILTPSSACLGKQREEGLLRVGGETLNSLEGTRNIGAILVLPGVVGEPATTEVCWGSERKKSKLFCVDPEFWLLPGPELTQEPGGRERINACTDQ